MSLASRVEVPSSLETGRLLLRCPRPDDAPEMYTAILESLPELRPWMRWAAELPDLERTAANLRASEVDFREGRSFQFLIFLKDSGILVGSSGMHEPDWSVPSFEIGYWVRTAYAGQGYIHETVMALSAMAFDRLDAHRISIICDANNSRSAAVARKAGFELEGIHRCDSRHFLSAELRDSMVFARIG